jgi:hypothetical protein
VSAEPPDVPLSTADEAEFFELDQSAFAFDPADAELDPAAAFSWLVAPYFGWLF